MKHFSAEEWSDYVRGLSPPEQRKEMEKHLQSGCVDCRGTIDWLNDVVQAAAEAAEPPEQLVAEARAVFKATEDRSWIDKLQQLAAESVFDSRRDALPAGVRSGASGTVRLRYRAAEYSVDLMLAKAESSLSLIGQIANESNPGEMMGGVLVQLIAAAGRTLSETKTNRFGEFVLDQRHQRGVKLRIALRDAGKKIDLPIG
jgi:hypothetical protein